VCQHFGILGNIQLNSDVTEIRWLEDEELWEVTVRHLVTGKGDLSASNREKLAEREGYDSVYLHTEKFRAKIVVSAVGGIVEPREFPADTPGAEEFEGTIFHSSRWDETIDFAGKNVVVLGTGASAAQFVPLLTKEPYDAKSVTQVMRSAPWVHPKEKEPGGKEKFAATAPKLFTNWPVLGRIVRTLMFLVTEVEYMTVFSEYNPKRAARNRRKLQEKYLEHMKQTVPSQYHDILTPDYEVGCKRRLYDAYWFQSLHDEKITLKKQPLKRLQAKSVVLGAAGGGLEDGEEEIVPADIIILANGFDIGNWFHPLSVVGREGRKIHDVWKERNGPQAYQGTAMDGFPNFFILFGPNTATGHSSVILAIENMVTYSLQFIRKILDADVELVEVKKEAEIKWTRQVQSEIQKSVFNRGGCTSWYIREGWNSTAYP
jgi:cation diffusion facilitator CzcD-associated flavoprotein CzcO